MTVTKLLVIRENLLVERLVPEARSADGPNGRPDTGQLAIPVARSAAGMARFTGAAEQRPSENGCYL